MTKEIKKETTGYSKRVAVYIPKHIPENKVDGIGYRMASATLAVEESIIKDWIMFSLSEVVQTDKRTAKKTISVYLTKEEAREMLQGFLQE